MKRQPKYSLEVIERAARMVSEAGGQYDSQWAAITSIAAKIDCMPETLRRWIRQQERDTGQRPGPTTIAAWALGQGGMPVLLLWVLLGVAAVSVGQYFAALRSEIPRAIKTAS
jgi:hypothetical protein